MAENDYTEVPEMPELPELPENFAEIAEATQERLAVLAASGVLKAIEKLNQTFSREAIEMIQSISRAIQEYWSTTIVKLAETASQLIDAVAKLNIPTLSEEEKKQLIDSHRLWGQYGWTYIPAMPIKMFYTAPADIKAANKRAIKYCSDGEMSKLFESLRNWKLNHSDLESAIFCYQNKQYKACALLLCGLIDSKLIRLQSDARRPVGAGAVAKLKANYDGSGEKMLAEAMFTYNLLAYLETLFAGGKGFKAEPETLNRNYIGHGMNHRAVRKRDCIQLFLALNNLMHFFDLGL